MRQRLLKFYQNLEIKKKKATQESRFVHLNRCLRTARKLGSSELLSSRGSGSTFTRFEEERETDSSSCSSASSFSFASTPSRSFSNRFEYSHPSGVITWLKFVKNMVAESKKDMFVNHDCQKKQHLKS